MLCRISKVLCKINAWKIFNLFAFIVPYNVLLYLPDVLLYLALTSAVFCIGAIAKPNWNKVYKKSLRWGSVPKSVFDNQLNVLFIHYIIYSLIKLECIIYERNM